MEILNYVLPALIFITAGYYLYKKYRDTYQKGKCAGCSSYGSCNKIYKVEIDTNQK